MNAEDKLEQQFSEIALSRGVSVQRFCEIIQAAKAGDAKAQDAYNEIARAWGYADWQECEKVITEEIIRVGWELPARDWIDGINFNPLLGQVLSNICGHLDDITSYPVFKMIRARLQQNEVRNDPVLGIIAKLPMPVLLYETNNNFDTPIRLALPDNTALDGGAADGFIPPDEKFGKRIYPGYNLAKAKEIADAFPKAWKLVDDDHEFTTKLTIKLIARHASINPTTCGRFLKVFRAARITHIYGIPIPEP